MSTNLTNLAKIPKSLFSTPSNPTVADYDLFGRLKPKAYDVPVDILAASVAWKRIRTEHIVHSFDSLLLDSALHQQVTEDDHKLAEVIRQYYGSKMTFFALSGTIEKSNFRKSLASFLQTDGKVFATTNLGMIYWLPYFYEYDLKLDTIKDQIGVVNQTCNGKQLVLEPIDVLRAKPTKSGNVEYWTKDVATGNAIVLKLAQNNPVIPLWDKLFTTSKTLSVKCKLDRTYRDSFKFYIADEWSLDVDNNSQP